MIKKELTGIKIKKALGLSSVSMRWHNKNKGYSNFGFNCYMDKSFIRGHDFEITGGYDAQTGEIGHLSIGLLYCCGHQIPKEAIISFEALIVYIKAWLYKKQASEGLKYPLKVMEAIKPQEVA